MHIVYSDGTKKRFNNILDAVKEFAVKNAIAMFEKSQDADDFIALYEWDES